MQECEKDTQREQGTGMPDGTHSYCDVFGVVLVMTPGAMWQY